MSGSKSVVSLNGQARGFEDMPAELVHRAQRSQRRAERELAARHEAERLLETKSLELFIANQRLSQLNSELEDRVEARTKQLDNARKNAVMIGSTDDLTRIANRLNYSVHLESRLAHARTHRGAVGLLLVDLDGFKLVNDTYGHGHGDELLIAIAGRLRDLTCANDMVARIGGDEFAIVIVAEGTLDIAVAAQRFRGAFERPVTIQGVTIEPRGSFGLAISPDHCDNSVDLQRFADLALYKSKSAALGEVIIFEKMFVQAYEYRQRMETEFRAALKLGKIGLNYQPIINSLSGKVEAVEALARWTDSLGVKISPDYFIPMAEQCGIIRGVGRSLLEKALSETGPWLREGLIERVSFNISPIELLDPGFTSAIMEALAKADLQPSHLMLEITEGAVVHNVDLAALVMNRLGLLGVAFALDDFGCGYSNLSTVRKLPISVLKLDRSLLVDAVTERAARVILRSVVNLCRELGIRSVCEGAETEAQSEFLREIKCDFIQGYASGKPQCATDLERSIRLGSRPISPSDAPVR